MSVVREEVQKLLARLRRQHVVRDIVEHTEGSFVVTLAPLRAMFEAAERRRDRKALGEMPPPPADPAALAGLSPALRARLRHLALLSIDSLGVRRTTPAMVTDEMQRLFAKLATATSDERLLAEAIESAIAEYE